MLVGTRGLLSTLAPSRRLSTLIRAGSLVAMLSARAARAGRAAGSRDRLIHDPADGPRATSALGAATEAAVNLTGGARRLRSGQHCPDVVVGQHVAGADDHGNPAFPARFSPLCNYRYMTPIVEAKTKRRFCRYSNLSPEVPPRGGPGFPFSASFDKGLAGNCARAALRRHR
jgi:hypothetical protein